MIPRSRSNRIVIVMIPRSRSNHDRRRHPHRVAVTVRSRQSTMLLSTTLLSTMRSRQSQACYYVINRAITAISACPSSSSSSHPSPSCPSFDGNQPCPSFHGNNANDYCRIRRHHAPRRAQRGPGAAGPLRLCLGWMFGGFDLEWKLERF